MSFIKDVILKDYTNRYWKLREKYLKQRSTILKVWYYVRVKRMERKCNAEFGVSYHDRSAEFWGRPNLPHGLNGIIISRRSTIGKNVTILQQVTIGTKVTSKMHKGVLKGPVVGNNCYIGAGAKIIGDIRVGNNVLIGANAVVIDDVPDNCTVVGIPAKIYKSKNNYNLSEGEWNANS